MNAEVSPEVCILVPAYNPIPALVTIVQKLGQRYRVIVVDDGSSRKFQAVFAALEALECTTVLRHAINRGKGEALKTGFNHVLTHYPTSAGVVTADADGQHLPEDIHKIALALQHDSAALHLGVRQFKGDVPLRSRIGNTVTRGVFRIFGGREVSDTQTGLRGIPVPMLSKFMGIKASRYDFELEMLLSVCRDRARIVETPIATVYENGNATSHFNPIIDSFKIYFVFLRFSALSLTTALLDYIVFTMVWQTAGNLLISLLCARLVAGTFNFTLARKMVFKSRNNLTREAASYVLLVISLMAVSYGLVQSMTHFLHMNVYVSKLIAEGGLFIASFSLQNLLIFTKQEDVREEN